MTEHDRVAKIVVDSILKKFKEGEWVCCGNLGKDFYRVATPKTHPSPDHAFYDDANDIGITFEYKPQTEKQRGILTGLGQSIAYLNKSDISFLVIPKKLTENNLDIQHRMTEVFEKQVVGNLPVGLIVFDNDVPSEVSMIHNVDSLLGRDKVEQKLKGRFWAKHQDLPIPLFHLILHYYYLNSTKKNKSEHPFATCWKKSLVREKSFKTLEANTIKDVKHDVIKNFNGTNKLFASKTLNKLKRIKSSAEKTRKIKKEKEIWLATKDVEGLTSFPYQSWYANFVSFLQHIGVVVDKELTELGVKLYHLGLVNGPKSSIFREYFLKCVLEQGDHLDLIFDLDELTKEYRGKKTTVEIRAIMEKKYADDGMVKRKPGRVAGAASNTKFLKYEMILWNYLDVTQKIRGKPDLAFNWEKITRVCALPEL